jgi:hypothetical protein
MPHYRNGIEARVGDLIKGVTYNRYGKVMHVSIRSAVSGAA